MSRFKDESKYQYGIWSEGRVEFKDGSIHCDGALYVKDVEITVNDKSINVTSFEDDSGVIRGFGKVRLESEEGSVKTSGLRTSGHLEVNAESWELVGANVVGSVSGNVTKLSLGDSLPVSDIEKHAWTEDSQAKPSQNNSDSGSCCIF